MCLIAQKFPIYPVSVPMIKIILSQCTAWWVPRSRPHWNAYTYTLPPSGGNHTPGHAVMSGVGSPSQWRGPPTTAPGDPGCQQAGLAFIGLVGRMVQASTSTGNYQPVNISAARDGSGKTKIPTGKKIDCPLIINISNSTRPPHKAQP